MVTATVHLQSPSQANIALFRSLFRGREDVYARRFESRRTGKSGYAPAVRRPRAPIGRASATEAFLYRRLETLKDTRGCFELNARLPIAFDALGEMEVDLLCGDARVAIEIDGAQHLSDAVAWRRDRHKDRLLQENGHRVLRFLAEDVGKELDSVLDAILRALTQRRRTLS